MINTIETVELAGTSRVTINAWIKSGRCIGVSNLRRGFKPPRWQFESEYFTRTSCAMYRCFIRHFKFAMHCVTN